MTKPLVERGPVSRPTLVVLLPCILGACSFDASKLRASSTTRDVGAAISLPDSSSDVGDLPRTPADATPERSVRNDDVIQSDSSDTDVPIWIEAGRVVEPEDAATESILVEDAAGDKPMDDVAIARADAAVPDAGLPDAGDANDEGGGNAPAQDGGAGGKDSEMDGSPGLDSASSRIDGASFDIGSLIETGFPYMPTNFDPTDLGPGQAAASVQLNCGVSTFDSSTGVFTNWCGQPRPPVVYRSQVEGPDVAILSLSDLSLIAGSSLRLTGAYPVVLAIFGDATIAGTIDASAGDTMPGAGGNLMCAASQGADGNGSTARFSGASGGGGGGFGTAGGNSGIADTDGGGGVNAAASGGKTRGNKSLSPLMGGCAGGRAGGCSVDGGAGGGAVQISAAGRIAGTGTIRTNGGNGDLPCGASDEGGGTGGGSGGGILLEASSVSLTGATLETNGGTGGPDGAFFHCGGNMGGAGSTDLSKPGTDGINCVAGSPGGGGGYGRISITTR
jgi:hypothetical protein